MSCEAMPTQTVSNPTVSNARCSLNTHRPRRSLEDDQAILVGTKPLQSAVTLHGPELANEGLAAIVKNVETLSTLQTGPSRRVDFRNPLFTILKLNRRPTPKVLLEKEKKEGDECICDRPSGLVLCSTCGLEMRNKRVQRRCTQHKKCINLMDITACPQCTSSNLREYSVSPLSQTKNHNRQNGRHGQQVSGECELQLGSLSSGREKFNIEFAPGDFSQSSQISISGCDHQSSDVYWHNSDHYSASSQLSDYSQISNGCDQQSSSMYYNHHHSSSTQPSSYSQISNGCDQQFSSMYSHRNRHHSTSSESSHSSQITSGCDQRFPSNMYHDHHYSSASDPSHYSQISSGCDQPSSSMYSHNTQPLSGLSDYSEPSYYSELEIPNECDQQLSTMYSHNNHHMSASSEPSIYSQSKFKWIRPAILNHSDNKHHHSVVREGPSNYRQIASGCDQQSSNYSHNNLHLSGFGKPSRCQSDFKWVRPAILKSLKSVPAQQSPSIVQSEWSAAAKNSHS